VKLRFCYTRQGVPVEVEIEGRGLSPEGASSLLATCVREADSLVHTMLPLDQGIQGEVHAGEGVGADPEHPATARSPVPGHCPASPRPQRTRENRILSPSGSTSQPTPLHPQDTEGSRRE